jgi:glycosyltransferase involved in cell wall biosynthesis
MSLTVAIDVAPLVGARTGIGHSVARLVEELDALDGGPDLYRYVLSFRAHLPQDWNRLPVPAGVALRTWGRWGRPRARRWLRAADVVHGTNFVAPPTGLPTVVTVHDCSLVTRPDLVNAVVRRFVPVLRRSIAAGAWVHTPSAYVADQVRELFGTERVRAIHHGPPAPPVPLGPPLPGVDGRPYILAVATREPRKNLPRLVDAFGLLHAEQPDVALVLLGAPGPDQPQVDAAIARLPRAAAEAVLLTDWVPDDQRTTALAAATVLAYPSIDEGFGLPLLEAMQVGVPVVAAAAGAIPEVAGDAALLVPPEDTEALATALARAVGDRATRDGLVAAGRERVAAFSWQRAAASLVALYGDAAMDTSTTGTGPTGPTRPRR